MQQNNIADRLKTLRKALKLSQTDFGKKIGKNYHSVMRWEIGRVLPPINVIEYICKVFGVSQRWLVDGEGEMLLSKDNVTIAEKETPYVADYQASNIPLYNSLDDKSTKNHIHIPTLTTCSFAIYAPKGSSPPISERDIIFIDACKSPNDNGLYLVTDKYGDTFIRFYNIEKQLWQSKQDGYPDFDNSAVIVHGKVCHIFRDIQF